MSLYMIFQLQDSLTFDVNSIPITYSWEQQIIQLPINPSHFILMLIKSGETTIDHNFYSEGKISARKYN